MPETAEAPTTAALSLERTLPASLAHKHAIEQVFVTDWMEGPGDDICTIAAQLPLAHARFSDGAAPYHDIVMLAEVVRQGGLVVASKVLDVPPGQQFLLRELRVSLDPIEANLRGPDTTELTISQDPSSTIKMRRGGSMTGAMMRARLAVAGRPSGTCDVVGAWVPDEMYEGFRGSNASGGAGPVDYAADDREPHSGKSARNTVVTRVRATGDPGAYAANAIVEPADPTFFDHPLDHVPGLLLLEVMQQLAVAATCHEQRLEPDRVAVSSLAMKFSRIAEFSPDIECSVRLDPDGRGGEVSCSQLDKTCCAGTVGVAVV
jgi:2-oxo-3-(phosphooxy)propyl 3-oxoalkanoate synthase